MTHLLDQHTNGHIPRLEPLHTHAEFKTTLRLPSTQRIVIFDTMSPKIFMCAVAVGFVMWLGIGFAAWKLGGWLFEQVSHVFGGM